MESLCNLCRCCLLFDQFERAPELARVLNIVIHGIEPDGEELVAFGLSSDVFDAAISDLAELAKRLDRGLSEVRHVGGGDLLKNNDAVCDLVESILDVQSFRAPAVADYAFNEVVLVASPVSRVVNHCHVLLADQEFLHRPVCAVLQKLRPEVGGCPNALSGSAACCPFDFLL